MGELKESPPEAEPTDEPREPRRGGGFVRRVGFAAWLTALVLVAVVVAVNELEGSPTSPGRGLPGLSSVSRGTPVDRPAPSFSLPALNGAGSISLGSFGNRVLVLNFWASWCTACRREAPILESLWRQHRNQGIQFLGVDHRDSRNAALAFGRQFGVTYRSVFDPKGSLASAYGLIGIPTTLIIQNGRVRYQFLGIIDTGSFNQALSVTPPPPA